MGRASRAAGLEALSARGREVRARGFRARDHPQDGRRPRRDHARGHRPVHRSGLPVGGRARHGQVLAVGVAGRRDLGGLLPDPPRRGGRRCRPVALRLERRIAGPGRSAARGPGSQPDLPRHARRQDRALRGSGALPAAATGRVAFHPLRPPDHGARAQRTGRRAVFARRLQRDRDFQQYRRRRQPHERRAQAPHELRNYSSDPRCRGRNRGRDPRGRTIE